MKRRIYK